jgi:radical SAM protein with 4Fe4S-binding SPASM domain
MDFELYKKVIDEGTSKGVKAVKLQSRGESMLYPKIIEAIRYARQKGILDIHLTTNGTIMPKEKWGDILSSGLNTLNFSIDANHRDSFNELHGEGAYDKVIDNLEEFLIFRKKFYDDKPVIKVQTASSPDKPDPYIEKQVARIHGYVDKSIVSSMFVLFGDKARRSSNKNSKLCAWLWQRMVINYDGKVTICCRDYNCNFIVGDIMKMTLEEIWQGQEYSRIRDIHSKGLRKSMPICAICETY